MKIAVTGASGLIGTTLVEALRSDGHDVLKLVRRTPRTADEHRQLYYSFLATRLAASATFVTEAEHARPAR